MGKFQKTGRVAAGEQAWTPQTLRAGNRILIVFPFGVLEMPLLQFDPRKYLEKGK